jgi:hypothetical protein
MSEQPLEVLELAQAGCYEVIALDSGAAYSQVSQRRAGWQLLADWPTSPGDVRHTADGSPGVLHFAPGRWLLSEPSTDLLDAIAEHPSAVIVDVEGKWQRRSLRGGGALRLLAAAADVEAMLADRRCAAMSLFGCPAIVARAGEAIELWVHASYARFFDEQLAVALSRTASRRAP